MEKITVVGLLKKYKNWITKDEIQFLHNNSEGKKEVLNIIEELILDISKANREGELSENLDWSDTHEKGRNLWEKLASCALNDLDQDSKGNSELFKFLDAATSFEDILYGLEPYYRDHTLHSLWVYFIGEYILRDLIPDISNDLNWHLFNDIETDQATYAPSLLKQAKKMEKEICAEVNKKKDAVWCLIALCHDLGYSLSKLDKLNNKALGVLKFFDMPNFNQIGYTLDIEQQHLITQFLELMSIDIRIVPSISEKDIYVKCYRDDSTFWRLCRALEKKQHGVYSSYLLYKILGIFADTFVRGYADEWGLNDLEVQYNIIRGDILFAIAQHEFDFAHLNKLSSLAELLVIADELEEFSRYGRQLLSRKYYDTMAETNIRFENSNPKQGDDIEIFMDYEVADHRKLANFYILKAERLCKIYSLDQVNEEDKHCTINKIVMSATKKDKKLNFHLCRNQDDTKGYLPKAIIENKNYEEGYYKLKCLDDKIMVKIDTKNITLDNWFQNVDDIWWKDNYEKLY
ncbi:hypothetical protein ACFLSE_06605 [Bacteroidota bacterium]